MAATVAAGRTVLAAGRLIVAGVVITAVVVQLAVNVDVPGYRVTNYFSYFTIESNILGAAAFLAAGIAGFRRRNSQGLGVFRGAATVYLAVTGLVYNLLLRGLEASLGTTVAWTNTVFHVLFPIIAVLDWVLDRSVRPLPYRTTLLFLIFPLAYLVYSLLRGPIVDWYPYPFLDPRPGGYGSVVLWSLFVAAVCGVFAFLAVWSTRLGRSSTGTQDPSGIRHAPA